MEFEPAFRDNRREQIRIRFRDSVQFEEKALTLAGGSVGFDISEGGIRMRFNDYVPIGSELTLAIALKGRIVDCVGRVVWIQKHPYSDYYQAGLQFETCENLVDSRVKIHQYIESSQS